tara:strand:+ start:252 stop:956 length:705 start_codon:yes stop_codon:yes gene_type:complete
MSTLREVVVDTETTGLNYRTGDRVIEIGCVELKNHIPTGKNLQLYFNPETKSVPEEAIKIHGLDDQFLKKHKPIRESVDDIINFLDKDTLIIHNAEFDLGFINNELNLCKKEKLTNPIIDTVTLARRKLGSGPVNLDALCKRFNIDLSQRKLHGALLDSSLLAEVYIELLGGRQTGLELKQRSSGFTNSLETKAKAKTINRPKLIDLSGEEKEAHKKFINTIKNPAWLSKIEKN